MVVRLCILLAGARSEFQSMGSNVLLGTLNLQIRWVFLKCLEYVQVYRILDLKQYKVNFYSNNYVIVPKSC